MLNRSLVDTWSFFKIHVSAISTIILPIVAPIEILTTFYQYYFASEEFVLSERLIPTVIWFVAYPIYTVGIVFYIASVISGGPIDANTSWRLGIKFWVPYVIMSVFMGIVIIFGLFLLIIPGIIFAIRYAFSEFELLLNQRKPLDAMKHSWDITKDYMWVILGGYIIITLVLNAPYYFLGWIFDEASVAYWVLVTMYNIISSVVAAMYTIFAFRVYEFAKSQH